jgi:hypothetical protein
MTLKKYYLIVQGKPDLIYLGKFRSLAQADAAPHGLSRRARWVILTKAELSNLALQSQTSELKD